MIESPAEELEPELRGSADDRLRARRRWTAPRGVSRPAARQHRSGASARRPAAVGSRPALPRARRDRCRGGRRRPRTGAEGVRPGASSAGPTACRRSASTAQTIAIVDAYDDPNIASRPQRLQRRSSVSRTATAPTAASRRSTRAAGAGPYPQANSGWARRSRSTSRSLTQSARTARSFWSRRARTASRTSAAAVEHAAAKLGANEISEQLRRLRVLVRGERHRLQPPGNRGHGRLGRQRLRLLRVSRPPRPT